MQVVELSSPQWEHLPRGKQVIAVAQMLKELQGLLFPFSYLHMIGREQRLKKTPEYEGSYTTQYETSISFLSGVPQILVKKCKCLSKSRACSV